MMKADSTQKCSQVVPHPSTIRALCHLTSEVKRDPVHLTWYGRQRRMASADGNMPRVENMRKRPAIGLGKLPCGAPVPLYGRQTRNADLGLSWAAVGDAGRAWPRQRSKCHAKPEKSDKYICRPRPPPEITVSHVAEHASRRTCCMYCGQS